MNDPVMDAVKHSQRLAYKQGEADLAVEVWGWAIKYGAQLPEPALRELFDMLRKEDE